ncbi:MAG: FadR family transcriptional regulator [Spirochaetaceae bacterium]|jgi:GntR family transcriptional repressor for pyruvate dehydrogenase complex|nr:FadR family transcriptional regulator [Spirochaetaceae bacterium]
MVRLFTTVENKGEDKNKLNSRSSIEAEPIERIVLIDQIIGVIKRQISEGKIKPGDKIPGERTLSELFHVSRTSIRQALKALDVLGVLDIRHGSATTLNKDISSLLINPLKFMSILYNVEIPEFFEVRKTIEVELARKAAIHATEEDINIMKQCLNKMEDNINNPDIFLYSEKYFHECVFTVSRNRLLTAMINSLNTILIGSRQESIKTFTDLRESFNQHLDIFKAIEKREPENAGQAMLAHIEDVERRLCTIDSDYLQKELNKVVIG